MRRVNSLGCFSHVKNIDLQLKSCQLPRNSAETIYTTSPDQIDGMKSEV